LVLHFPAGANKRATGSQEALKSENPENEMASFAHKVRRFVGLISTIQLDFCFAARINHQAVNALSVAQGHAS
jgi:hypothetical protein